MIISRTPYRVSFFGGGTDYPSWYHRHGGAVLAATIDKYCYLTCRYLPPFFEHRFRAVYSRIETCQTVDEIAHPAVREVLKYLSITRGVEIHHDGDLPARSGTGSSSAFTVGLLHALHALEGRMVDKHRLAQESIFLEQHLLCETVGSQDQVLAAYGGLNHVVFDRQGEIAVRPVILPSGRKEALGAHLMLFYTGIKRTASDVASSYVARLIDHEAQLHRIREMVDAGLAILTGGELTDFGELLHEGWVAKSSLGTSVTNREVDQIYEEARAAGAIGGKLLGAGGGGFMLLFVRPEDRRRVRQRLSRLLHVPFEFESSGSQIIFFDREKDYADEELARETLRIQPVRELAEIAAA